LERFTELSDSMEEEDVEDEDEGSFECADED
jgi:hypothetical protein